MTLPAYRELPIRPDLPPRSAWGVFGDDDEIGTINLLTPDRVRRGIECAKRGAVFPLNWSLQYPDPPLYGRGALKHQIDNPLEHIFDDSLNGFFTQASSQWDALNHVGHPEYGFYNGRSFAEAGGGGRNGIDKWADRGIAGRGVLIDIARHRASIGSPVDAGGYVGFGPQDVRDAADAQNVTIEQGDVLILRTGWIEWYERASAETRKSLAEDSLTLLRTPGLEGGEDVAEFLWDLHISAIAADNPAVEAWPHRFEVDQYLHYRLIPMLGIAMGEMWYLEKLAADCAADGVYEFLVTSAPLHIPDGVGSPPNVLAIK